MAGKREKLDVSWYLLNESKNRLNDSQGEKDLVVLE